MNSARYIAHIDMDAFFVSVERLHNKKLAGKAVLIGGFGERGLIAACSQEARVYGVYPGMPIKQARILCPQAVLVRGDRDAYSLKSFEITAIIADSIPDFEKTRIDEHYLDLSGYERFHGAFSLAHNLRECIRRETGLPVSLGLSGNKTVSKMATRTAAPDGELQVLPTEVREFLHDLPIKDMPGMGHGLNLKFAELGIRTIGQLSVLPKELLYSVAGKPGIRLWEKANGIDHSPVVPYRIQDSINRELTFETDMFDMKRINGALISMVEGIGYELRRQGKLASVVTVKIRYANSDTHTKETRLAYTASDQAIIDTADLLLKKVYDRRMMIRLLGIKVSGLIHGFQQMSLFETGSDMIDLYRRLDKIRSRYGANAVIRACGMEAQPSVQTAVPAAHLSTQALNLLTHRSMYYGR